MRIAMSWTSVTGSLVASARMLVLICFRAFAPMGTPLWQLRKNLRGIHTTMVTGSQHKNKRKISIGTVI